jgi:hypothetical protein
MVESPSISHMAFSKLEPVHVKELDSVAQEILPYPFIAASVEAPKKMSDGSVTDNLVETIELSLRPSGNSKTVVSWQGFCTRVFVEVKEVI